MGKGLLIIDMPTSCEKCPAGRNLLSDKNNEAWACELFSFMYDEIRCVDKYTDCKPDWCLLKEETAALEELDQYRSIGALDECRELIEKQKHKKPTQRCHFEEIGYWVGKCPFCGRDTTSQEEYCSSCGQALDWS